LRDCSTALLKIKAVQIVRKLHRRLITGVEGRVTKAIRFKRIEVMSIRLFMRFLQYMQSGQLGRNECANEEAPPLSLYHLQVTVYG